MYMCSAQRPSAPDQAIPGKEGACRASAGGRPGRIPTARPTRTTRRGAGRVWEPARRSVGRGRQSGPKVETDQNGVRARRQGCVHAAQMRQYAAGSRPARCPQERRMGGGQSLADSARKPRTCKLRATASERASACRYHPLELAWVVGLRTYTMPTQGYGVGDLKSVRVASS